MKSVKRKVNQLNNQLSNERSKVKYFCCPAGGIIVTEVCSKVFCTSLFRHVKNILCISTGWISQDMEDRCKDQTADAPGFSLSLFKFIYVSVKDITMLV